MLSVKKLIYKILQCPHVVEQNTSGNWTWHKWSDGTVEAWYNERINQSVAFTTHPANSYFYTNSDWTSKKINFPSGVFTYADVALANITCNGYITAFASAQDSTGVTVRACTTYSTTMTVNDLLIYVKGRWQ